MSIVVICPKCGSRNPPGRMYCMQCGGKIEMEMAETRAEKPWIGKAVSALGRAVRAAATILLLLAIVQMMRPVAPAGSTGNAQDVQRLRQKLSLFKGAVMDGKASSQRLSEVELNAYLTDLLARSATPDAMDSLRYRLLKVNLAVEPAAVVVVLRASLGPVPLSYEVTGAPRVDGKRFAFAPTAARFGHLPLPGPLRGWMAGRVYGVFSQMLDERSLLDQAEGLELAQGEVTLVQRGLP